MGFLKLSTTKQVIDCRWPFSIFLQPPDIIYPLFVPENGNEFPETVIKDLHELNFLEEDFAIGFEFIPMQEGDLADAKARKF